MTDDAQQMPAGWVDPIDNDELDWVVEADAEPDPQPPAERLAQEPEMVAARDNGQQHLVGLLDDDELTLRPLTRGEPRLLVAAAIPLDLRNYSQTPQQRGWGAPCTARLARVTIGPAAVTVASTLAELVGLIMRANQKQGYAYRQADTGAYNCRHIAGSSAWSWHSYGIAIDSNWQTNPYTSPLRTDRPVWERNRWNRYGFAGGWDYTGAKDAMHSEFMGTPAQAATLTLLARRELVPIINGTPPPSIPPTPAAPPWGLPSGHYYGHIAGPAQSHGGYYASEQDNVQWIQRRLIAKGCVPGVRDWRSSWADGRWEDPTTAAVRSWFARYRPGQPYTTRIYSDDYVALAR